MNSRRFLITLWPFTGHLLPQLSIAMALRERGHEVAFYSGEAVRDPIEREGFELFPFQRLDQERAFASMRAVDTGDRRARPGKGRLLPLLRDWLVETIPDQVADLRDVLGHWHADVIATDLSLWGPILVLWESERIPVALSSTFMGPLIPGPDAPAFGFGLRPPHAPWSRLGAAALTRLTELGASGMRRRVDELRVQYGLAPLGESVNRYTARLPLYIVGNLPALDYNRQDLPASVHYVGNCISYPDPADTPQWLEKIPTERPWVHVTESTLAYGEPFLLRTAVEALADQPVELIITTGDQRETMALGPRVSASNVHVAPWLSHGELLPRCSALVTVGGKATVLAAAEAGVPMVVVPTTWDKPDNARRVTEAGAGIRLSPRRLSAEGLRATVLEVLDQTSYREAAKRLATQLASAPGPPRAAELLEQLVPVGHPGNEPALLDRAST
ncbi:MAG: glycosyltransferase [Solirubrobacteraceae bacterium]|jgi:MGT family glycosyltransferase